MSRRIGFLVVGFVVLAGAFLFTQVRFMDDSRSLAHPYTIETLKNRDDLNVVFILIDTLRADHLGAWGYERDTSAYMDSLAERGIRFARHRSQSTWTKTSMASIWTGLTPQRSRILRFGDGLGEKVVMPAEIFADAGFRTVGLWRNGWVAPKFGFGQGFSLYHRPRPEAPNVALRRKQADDPRARLQGSDMDIVTATREFLRSSGDERFFLYMHYMDVHQYLCDTESAIFGTTYLDMYDNSIHWTDRLIRAIVANLEEKGVLDRTVIVIGSDHGEAFGEHGDEGHGKNLYDEVIHVPWIISLPFVLDEGIVVDTPTSNVDIWPTLFEMLGIEGVEGLDGHSRMPEIRRAAGLAPAVDAEAPILISHLDRFWGRTSLPYTPVVSIIDEPYKFIYWPTKPGSAELYDLSADPGETRNLVGGGTAAPMVQRYHGLLAEYLESPDAPWGRAVDEVQLDDMDKGQLRALGYVIE